MTRDDSNGSVSSPPKLLGGLLLIVIGLIFLAQGHDWLFGWHLSFSRLWPLLLIVIGLTRLSAPNDVALEAKAAPLADPQRRRSSHSSRGGLWLIFLGTIFLLHTNDIFRLRQSWPLFIVCAGLVVLFNRRPKSVATTTDAAAPPGSDQP